MSEKIIGGKKVYTINVRLQPYMYKWLKDVEAVGEYGNISDVVRTALFEFKTKIEKERYEGERRAHRLTKILHDDPELKEKVLKGLSNEGGV